VTRVLPAPGARVAFLPDTPPYEANVGIVYLVEVGPDGCDYSIDQHGRPYVWLVDERDVGRTTSRRRRRSGYVDALALVGGRS
jgi:hypothetical protein